jgi:two-component system cell cycle sensor histidine kinase/response regulator CckA
VTNDVEKRQQRAETLDALGRLSGGVAHDFNNLLTVILSYVSMLREAPPSDREALLADLAQIEDAARQAVEITALLLTFGRRQHHRPMTLDLGAYLREHEAEIQGVLAGRASLHLEIAADTGAVRLDPTHAGKVFKELAKNAAEQAPAGGDFYLQTRAVTLDDAFVAAHPGASTGLHVRIAARDSGPGFSAEAQKRLFEPFFTTKPRGQGSGLGLAMVYGIVHQNAGTIWLEDNELALYLPRPKD